jgi:hypothetical protein
MIEFRNPYHIIPPGSMYEILSKPFDESKVIELAVFQEHRYSFFYWVKWYKKQKLTKPPCLISFDWHQDLCFPSLIEKEWLKDLNLSKDSDVAVFSWAKLAGNNDGHILSAAYLNIIGDIYVHCRQNQFGLNWEDEEIVDLYGNTHLIKKFKHYEDLENHISLIEDEHVFFDIDLDFFVTNNPYSEKNTPYEYMSKSQIEEILDIKRPLIKWIFDRLLGFTIATEPTYCDGLLKSNELLDIVNNIYFEPSLFSSMENGCEWKHKLY